MRQCVEFQFIPRCCAEDSGSFYFVQAAEWFGDVFTVMGDVLDEFSWGSAAGSPLVASWVMMTGVRIRVKDW